VAFTKFSQPGDQAPGGLCTSGVGAGFLALCGQVSVLAFALRLVFSTVVACTLNRLQSSRIESNRIGHSEDAPSTSLTSLSVTEVYGRAVVPKMFSADPKGSATNSQGIYAYISAVATLKVT
jgi:hypothetical protein